MRHLLLTALGGLLLIPGAAPGADEEGDPSDVVWTHPWLHTRIFDYRHPSYGGRIKESGFKALYTRNDLVVRHLPDGSEVRTWDFELVVRDISSIPMYFRLAERSGVRKTEVTDFDVTWSSGPRTREYSVDDLTEYSSFQHSSYIDDSAGLFLPIGERAGGTLRGHVEVTDQPHPGFESLVAGMQFLGGFAAPSKERSITVEVPAGTPMQWETRFWKRDLPAPITEDGFDRYVFPFETLYHPLAEANMPSPFDSFPSLWWSNQGSWEELATHVDGVWEPHLVADDAMSAWAEEITEGADGPVAKAVAIHDAVARGWDYLGFYPGESGWIPHPARQCWTARIGDCKDKTALMITLMRAVGLDAHPALVNAGEPSTPPTAPVPFFNHAILYVRTDAVRAGGFFLDSVDGGIGSFPVSEWVSDRQALVVDEATGGLLAIPPTPAERWLEEDEAVVTLADDGSATAELVWRFVGSAGNRRASAASQTVPARWERSLRNRLLRAWPGAETLALTDGPDPDAPDDVWSTRATLSVPSLLSWQGEYGVLRVPWLDEYDPGSVSVESWRMHPVVTDPTHRRSSVRIRLPESLRVLALPEDGGEERDDWRSVLASSEEGGDVLVTLIVQEHPGTMEPTLEEARRNFVAGVRDLQDRVVVLRRAP